MEITRMRDLDKYQRFILALTLLIHLAIVCGWTIRVALHHAVATSASWKQK